MFKSAATRIAHNSTLPALALSGNKDLRPLQDLITAEKAVLIALQKLSVDFAKASEALRIWGAGEGEDLGDILGASTVILGHFSTALSGYAAREHGIRDHLKAVRTREEALDELKRRRKTTLARADSAEKKLNKMGPEHKNLTAQTDMLNQLQQQIRGMDGEIMAEEAALGDFKRTSAKALLGLKFGGLVEVCEKGVVVGECGRGVAGEVSEETTQPGLARAPYYGRERTQGLVDEAQRCVDEVVFSADAAGSPPKVRIDATRTDNFSQNLSPNPTGGYENNSIAGGFNPDFNDGNSEYGGSYADGGRSQYEGSTLNVNTNTTGGSYLTATSTGGSYLSNTTTGGSFQLPPPDVGASLGFTDAAEGGVQPGGTSPSQYQPPTAPFQAQSGGTSPGGTAPGSTYPGGTVSSFGGTASSFGGTSAPTASSFGGTAAPDARDDFGVGLAGAGGAGEGGGRFATFPVRGRGYSVKEEQGGTPGASRSELMGPRTEAVRGGTEPLALRTSPMREESGDFMAAVLDAGKYGKLQSPQQQQQQQQQQQPQQWEFARSEKQQLPPPPQEEEPAPEYRDYDHDYSAQQGGYNPSSQEYSSHSQVYESVPGKGQISGPPPGAAAPVVGGHWVGQDRQGLSADGPEQEGDRRSMVSEDAGLAYMSGEPEEYRRASPPAAYQQPQQDAYNSSPGGYQPPQPQEAYQPPYQSPPTQYQAPSTTKHVRFGHVEDESTGERLPFGTPPASPLPNVEAPFVRREASNSSLNSRIRRVPPPSMSPEPTPEDERALNAAAAREVSRELDALGFNAAAPERARSPPQFTYPTPPAPNRENSYSQPPNREPSPLIPPSAPFRQQTLESPVTIGHRSSPSQGESPAQPTPSAPSHHTTPSWALSPAENPPSPSSPRLDAPFRGLASSPANRSTSSLNSQVQVPPGARTISAAAFRRPQKPASGDVADTSPLSLKKRLPTSPYPQQRQASSSLAQPPQALPPVQQVPPPADDFDYIGAYARDPEAFTDAGNPQNADFDYGRLGKVEVVGGVVKSPGYAEGRFATDPNDVR